MPPHSRAQRRRQPARGAVRQQPGAPAGAETEILEEAEAPRAPVAAPAGRGSRQVRRPATRVLEPVDYSEDYSSARQDLIRIGVISVLLFAAMVGLRFSGLL